MTLQEFFANYDKQPLITLLNNSQIARLLTSTDSAQLLIKMIEHKENLLQLGFNEDLFEQILFCNDSLDFLDLILENIDTLLTSKITAQQVVATKTTNFNSLNFAAFIKHQDYLTARGLTNDDLMKIAQYRSARECFTTLHKRIDELLLLGFNVALIKEICSQPSASTAIEKIYSLKEKINGSSLRKEHIVGIIRKKDRKSLETVLDNVEAFLKNGFELEDIVRFARLDDAEKLFELLSNKDTLLNLQQRGFTIQALTSLVKEKGSKTIEYRLYSAERLEILINTESLTLPNPFTKFELKSIDRQINELTLAKKERASLQNKINIQDEQPQEPIEDTEQSNTSLTNVEQTKILAIQSGKSILENFQKLLELGYKKADLVIFLNHRFPKKTFEALVNRATDLEIAGFSKEQVIQIAAQDGIGAFCLETLWISRVVLKTLLSTNEITFQQLQLIMKHHKWTDSLAIICSSEEVIQKQYNFTDRKQAIELATKSSIQKRTAKHNLESEGTNNHTTNKRFKNSANYDQQERKETTPKLSNNNGLQFFNHQSESSGRTQLDDLADIIFSMT